MKLKTPVRAETGFCEPLLEQSQALTRYLDSLFRDLPADVAGSPAAAEVPQPPASIVTPAEVPQPPASTPAAAGPADVEPRRSPAEGFDKTPFSCLQLVSGNLRLAVPMSALFGVRRMPEKPGRLPNAPAWVAGLLGGGEKVQVVDLAALLSEAGSTDPSRQAPSHAVIIAEGRWAIGCEAPGRTLHVDPSLVRWSSGGARDPWLAGIVPGELCTLLDPTVLVAWLDRGGPAGD